jgi:hypothetical protein
MQPNHPNKAKKSQIPGNATAIASESAFRPAPAKDEGIEDGGKEKRQSQNEGEANEPSAKRLATHTHQRVNTNGTGGIAPPPSHCVTVIFGDPQTGNLQTNQKSSDQSAFAKPMPQVGWILDPSAKCPCKFPSPWR